MPRSRPLALVLVAALVAAATASTANATSTATTSALPASPAETASTAASTSPASASAPSDAQPKPRVRARDVGSGHRFVRRASAPRGLSSGIGVRRRCGCVGPTSYGKENDQLTSLSYYGFRFYDRLTLTWTQADPLYRFAPDLAWDEPRRANPYSFSLNNPLRYYDPDGRSPCGAWWTKCPNDQQTTGDQGRRQEGEVQKKVEQEQETPPSVDIAEIELQIAAAEQERGQIISAMGILAGTVTLGATSSGGGRTGAAARGSTTARAGAAAASNVAGKIGGGRRLAGGFLGLFGLGKKAADGAKAIEQVVAGSGGSIKKAVAGINHARLNQSQAIQATTRVAEASGRRVGPIVDVGAGAKVIPGVVPGVGKPIVHVSPTGTAAFGSADVTIGIDAAGYPFATVTNIVLP